MDDDGRNYRAATKGGALSTICVESQQEARHVEAREGVVSVLMSGRWQASVR